MRIFAFAKINRNYSSFIIHYSFVYFSRGGHWSPFFYTVYIFLHTVSSLFTPKISPSIFKKTRIRGKSSFLEAPFPRLYSLSNF